VETRKEEGKKERKRMRNFMNSREGAAVQRRRVESAYQIGMNIFSKL
jgi:hypothetical protein